MLSVRKIIFSVIQDLINQFFLEVRRSIKYSDFSIFFLARPHFPQENQCSQCFHGQEEKEARVELGQDEFVNLIGVILRSDYGLLCLR